MPGIIQVNQILYLKPPAKLAVCTAFSKMSYFIFRMGTKGKSTGWKSQHWLGKKEPCIRPLFLAYCFPQCISLCVKPKTARKLAPTQLHLKCKDMKQTLVSEDTADLCKSYQPKRQKSFFQLDLAIWHTTVECNTQYCQPYVKQQVCFICMYRHYILGKA